MNTTNMNQTNSNTTPPIKWNDFLDIENEDDFDFKILDEGLGFHHSKETEQRRPNRISKQVAKQRLPEAHTSRKTLSHLEEVSMPSSLPGAHSERTNRRPNNRQVPKVQKKIVARAQVKTKIEETKKIKPKLKIKAASMEARFSAFLIDAVVLASIMFAYVFMGSFLLGVSVDQFTNIILREQYIMFLAGISLMTYILYFSLLDCTQSVGKKALNIRVIKVGSTGSTSSNERSNLLTNVTRSILVLTVLPVVFGFQDNLSDTKVVECN